MTRRAPCPPALQPAGYLVAIITLEQVLGVQLAEAGRMELLAFLGDAVPRAAPLIHDGNLLH